MQHGMLGITVDSSEIHNFMEFLRLQEMKERVPAVLSLSFEVDRVICLSFKNT